MGNPHFLLSKTWSVLFCLSFLSLSIQAQNVARIEYYIDSDPGFGKGTNVPMTAGQDVTVSFSIPITNLSSGFHNVYTRSFVRPYQVQENGKPVTRGGWSLTNMRTFYKETFANSSTALPNVSKGEYFLDTDPGFGKGTNIPLSAGTNLTNLALAIDITSLSTGFHQLYVRFRDANGNWSLTDRRTLYKESLAVNPIALPNIIKGEYFVDTDPGFGKGINIPVSPASNLNNINLSADLTSLTAGFHHLYVRFKDANDNWSLTQVRTFYKETSPSASAALPNIVQGEYFVDTDSGFGKGTNIPVTPGSNLGNIAFAVNITSVSNGFHKLFTRFKDADGRWGITNTRAFYKENVSVTEPLSKITKLEYFIDEDPGFGKGKTVSVTAATDLNNVIFEIDPASFSLGDHTIFVRAQNEKGAWSITNRSTFRLEPPSGVFLTLGSVEQTLCIGSEVTIPFTVNSPFSAGNVFTAQLSDANGSFESPRDIGTLTGTGSGSILAQIPSVATGTNYRVRISSSNPARVSTANNQPLSIHRVPPVFSIEGDTVSCLGTQTYSLQNVESGGGKYVWTLSGGGSLQAKETEATITWATTGVHTLKAKYTGVCAGEDSVKTLLVTVINQPLTGRFQNLLPQDKETELPMPVAFTWSPIPNAQTYDLYIWPDSLEKPASPTIADLTAINYTVSSSSIIQYDKTYKWQVVAKRACYELASPIRTFRTRRLPDLIVESVTTPATSISETDLTISWVVKNQGDGAANGEWQDQIYLSDQPDLATSTEKHYIGSVGNFSTLNAGQSYRYANFTFKIPQGLQGDYYVIVTTNSYQVVREKVSTNNEKSSSVVKVTLAPPPDLQVSALTVSPLSAFSEDEITVTYTVANKGTGPTTATRWSDYIYIGTAETVNGTTDRLLGTVSRDSALAVNGTYTVIRKFRLPARISGQYYIHVVTDRNEQVFEYNKEDNNSLNSLAMTIIQRPTPNLVISDVSVSQKNVSNGQNLIVTWTTANEGSIAAVPQWNEGIYLSTDQTLDISQDRLIGSFVHRDSLFSLSNNRIQQNVQIPSNLKEGDYYLFVVTDVTNTIYENPDEEDNTARLTDKITVGNPDLKPISVTAPATASSGESITVQWKVKNESSAAIFNTNWTDRIYLSKDQSLNPAADVLLASTQTNQFLIAEGEYAKSASVSLPEQISGDYYLILVTDGENTIFERVETNNTQAIALKLSLSPWPDLELTTLVAPSRDTVGTSIAVQYTVKNNGTGSLTNKNWSDGVYLSPTATLNEATQILLGNTFQRRNLAGGQSYTQQTSFLIPGNLVPGSYYVIVKADVTQTVFENNAKANNLKASSTPTTFVALPQTDLAVVTGQILSQSVTAGQSVNLQWTVKNNSSSSTVIPSWTDAVFLSTNPVLDAGDQLLASTPIASPLNTGGTYTKNLTVSVPQEAGGTVFFIVNVDRFNQHNDNNRGNNTLAMTVDGGSETVQVITPPPADLVPTLVSVPAQGVASQPITVIMRVKNNGTGPTPASLWTDHFYLSADAQTGADISLGARTHTGVLAAGAEYRDTLQLILPPNVSGNYYILHQTDAGNAVFERGKEDNNLAVASTFISPQQPSDLIVKEVTVPSGPQFAGENTSVSWVLTNTGTNAARGFLRDAVYISPDSLLDASDVLLGTLEKTVDLSVQASVTHTLESPLANLAIGTYYVIVKTDILDNIVEQNNDNNQTVSISKFTVTVRELPMNVLTSATLKKDVPLYYRIEIPANLAGETLSVTLKGDSTNGAINRFFIRKGLVPTANQYDHVGNLPFQANQELIIPALQAGTYYLMALGGSQAAQTQPVGLLARIIPFGIKAVDASQGGNTGLVTIKITGARFEPRTIFRLKRGTETIQALRIQYINQTLAYVTFNLLNKPLGRYDAEAVNPGGTTALLAQSFTIRQGTGSLFTSVNAGSPGGSGFVCSVTNVGFEDQFETDVVSPANARLSVITSFIVSYQNNGSVDIPIPTKYLLSLNENVPVGFSVGELKENKNDLILECKEEGGPPGILRPGAGGFFKVYTVSNNREIPSIDIVITD